MKIVMCLMSGDQVEITQEESGQIVEVERAGAKLMHFPRLNRTIPIHQITDIKEIRPVVCTKCGVEFYPGENHYCDYKSSERIIEELPDVSENIKKLKVQVTLARKFPAGKAYEQAWGSPMGKTARQLWEDRAIKDKVAYVDDMGNFTIKDAIEFRKWEQKEYSIAQSVAYYEQQGLT
jgi:hypothetical protein